MSLCRIVTSLFQRIVPNESLMEKLRHSIVFKGVCLMTFKKIVDNRVSFASSQTQNLKIECPEFKSDRLECLVKHVVGTCFNVGANNLTILLNRR